MVGCRLTGPACLTAGLLAWSLFGTGCAPSESLDDVFVLREDGITVFVEREPYGLTVWANGEAVLSTLGPGSGDGYGGIGVTTGSVEWGAEVSPGYVSFEPDLDPWRDDWVVVAATAADTTLDVVLVAPDDEDAWSQGGDVATMMVHHAVEASTLEVTASVTNLEDGDPRAWEVAFHSPSSEAFVGFGERFNRIDQRGVDVYSWAEEGGLGTGEGDEPGPDNPQPNGEAMTYYPVPFFLSTEGYGFWLETTWYNTFNLATDDPKAWRAWHVGPELAYHVYVPYTEDERPWPYHIMDHFTSATGRPMLPPTWTFGPRRRVGRTSTVDGIAEIQRMRQLDLAITAVDDAVHFLPSGSHVGVEDELKAWTDYAKSLGYRVNAYYNPYFDSDPASPLADVVSEGVDNGYFLKDGEGEPSLVWLVSGDLVWVYTVDFTSNDATQWFQSTLQWAIDAGYNGWMYDFGEYVQPDVVAASGMTGEELHNYFPVLYQRAASLYLQGSELADDWLMFARSGYTGASAWTPMVWSGDPAASFESSDGLPSMIRGGLNLGISGAPHSGGDIGGFHCVADGWDAADGELLARWIQQGSMMSNMQDQNACSGAAGDGQKASIWTSDDAMESWATYAKLHTRLFPYFYALAIEATNTGAPVMRQLFLEHPDRRDLIAVDDAYYLGPTLLVAPVVERGARQRDVVLPPGWFLDYHDHTLYEGDQTITVDAPLSELPLFLREGGIIPLLDDQIDTLASENSEDIVGPSDVSEIYDIIGLVGESDETVVFDNWGGGTLEVDYRGGFAPPDLPIAADPADLKRCDGCWLEEEAPEGVRRIRISSTAETVVAGGLQLRHDVGRQVRWDLFLRE